MLGSEKNMEWGILLNTSLQITCLVLKPFSCLFFPTTVFKKYSRYIFKSFLLTKINAIEIIPGCCFAMNGTEIDHFQTHVHILAAAVADVTLSLD